jgi:hypothetical protein
MARTVGAFQTDPYSLPRPYPMVVAMLQHKTGIKMSATRAQQVEKNALKKLRKALSEVMNPEHLNN